MIIMIMTTTMIMIIIDTIRWPLCFFHIWGSACFFSADRAEVWPVFGVVVGVHNVLELAYQDGGKKWWHVLEATIFDVETWIVGLDIGRFTKKIYKTKILVIHHPMRSSFDLASYFVENYLFVGSAHPLEPCAGNQFCDMHQKQLKLDEWQQQEDVRPLKSNMEPFKNKQSKRNIIFPTLFF